MKRFLSREKSKWLGVLATAVVSTTLVQAVDYSIDQHAIGSGGSSSGGVYQASGTVQPAGGLQFAGGAYEVLDGFWTVVMAVQSSEAPQLSIVRNGNNLTISWPSGTSGYVLEEATSLNSPIFWQPASGGAGSSLTISLSAGPKFYRLKKP